MVWGIRWNSIFFSIFSCSAWSTWLDRCTSPTGSRRLNKTKVLPSLVLHFLTPYTRTSCHKYLFLFLTLSPPLCFLLTLASPAAPTHPPPHLPPAFRLMRLSLVRQVPGLWVLHLRLGRAHPEQYEPRRQGRPHERRLSQGELSVI